MPVFNSAKYLHASIRSILDQTFSDFQFLIIDDGSLDGGQEIVKSFQDPRIHLVQNEFNLGVAATLNKGLALSKTKYIVRMDADDVSISTRLARQLEMMERDTDLDICGSWVRTIEADRKSQIIRYPTEPTTIQSYFLFNNPLAHPSVILRRSSLQRHSLCYDERIGAGQDYEFWSRCAEFCRIKNIPEPLVLWRRHSQGETEKNFRKSNNTALLVQKRELGKLGIDCDGRCLEEHRRIGSGRGMKSCQEVEKALSWLSHLIQLNRCQQQYDAEGFGKVSAMVWFRLCMNSSTYSVRVFRTYLSAPFRSYYTPYPAEISVFIYHTIMTFFRSHQPV